MDDSKEHRGTDPSIASKDTSQLDDAASTRDVEKQPVPENNAIEDSSREKDPNIVDWDGPDDPANPMNWSSGKKVTAVGIVSMIAFLSPFASTVISPASGDVMKTFHSTNETLGAFVTTVYLIGYVFGPLVIAPLSELYGRAILYNICNFIFLIFNIACALAPNLGALIVFRLLAGIAASCPITLGPGTVADIVSVEKRGLAMTGVYIGPLIGPTFAPLAASYLAEAKGWRWIFWLISIMAGAIWVAAMLFVRESYAYVLLKWKTKRLQKETGNLQLRSALNTGQPPAELFKISIIRPLKMLFMSPMVFLLSLYMAIIYGYLYLLFTTYPRVFQGQYGFSNGAVGFAYLGSGIGSFIGLFFCGATSDRLLLYLTKRNGGTSKPEYRLPVMAIGAFLVPIGLFLYAWTTEYKKHWILPIIGSAFLGAGIFTIFMPAGTYLVDAFTVHAASVTASSTVIRSLVGALLPLAGNKMYDALGLGWGTSLLGFIAVAFIPMPLILWTFGERLRESRFSQVKF